MTATRRLAAILSVDIAGYSRLKGRFRRISPVLARPGERHLTEPDTSRSALPRERVFVP